MMGIHLDVTARTRRRLHIGQRKSDIANWSSRPATSFIERMRPVDLPTAIPPRSASSGIFLQSCWNITIWTLSSLNIARKRSDLWPAICPESPANGVRGACGHEGRARGVAGAACTTVGGRGNRQRLSSGGAGYHGRKRVEQALRESEAVLKAFQSSPAGMTISRLEDGRCSM